MGDTVVFGSYELDGTMLNGREDFEWLVLDKQDNRLLLLSKYALTNSFWHSKNIDITWEGSYLRSWLNGGGFFTSFTDEEADLILTTRVKASRNLAYSTDPGNDTEDKLFLLSCTEVDMYLKGFFRQCEDYAGQNTCAWWLRTPGDHSNYAAYVDTDGNINYGGELVYREGSEGLAIRPALWVEIPPTDYYGSLYTRAEDLLSAGNEREAAMLFARLGSYGDAYERSLALWDKLAQRDTISAGGRHTVALKADGSVLAAGENKDGQCDVGEWQDVTAVNAGLNHTVCLKADSTVLATGSNISGQCNVERWQRIVSISAGYYHTVGLKADGSLVATGVNTSGQCLTSDLRNIAAVSAGGYHTLALKSDGTVAAVGSDKQGQCQVNDWKDIIAIAAGGVHSVGLRADGTVVAAGSNTDGQCDVGDWSNIVAIAAGGFHTVGLKADGTVVAAGSNKQGQCDIANWQDIAAISASETHTIALKTDGTMLAAGNGNSGKLDVDTWQDIRVNTP